MCKFFDEFDKWYNRNSDHFTQSLNDKIRDLQRKADDSPDLHEMIVAEIQQKLAHEHIHELKELENKAPDSYQKLIQIFLKYGLSLL